MQVGSTVEDFVTVDGKQYAIKVSRVTATVWRAYGDFGTKRIEAKGDGYSGAVSRWEIRARNEDAPPV